MSHERRASPRSEPAWRRASFRAARSLKAIRYIPGTPDARRFLRGGAYRDSMAGNLPDPQRRPSSIEHRPRSARGRSSFQPAMIQVAWDISTKRGRRMSIAQRGLLRRLLQPVSASCAQDGKPVADRIPAIRAQHVEEHGPALRAPLDADL